MPFAIPTSTLAAYQGKTILLSGASGYVATKIVDLLKGVDCEIRLLSRAKINAPSGTKAKFKIFHGDIREKETWRDCLSGAHVVFHLASQTSVYTAAQDPAADWAANVKPLLAALECSRENRFRPHFVFASTATVIGLSATVPVNENHPANPVSVYDLHKLQGEQYLKLFCDLDLVTGCSLRLANVYGPGPERSSSDRGILNMMAKKALSGETLKVYGEGRFVRDYVFIDDVAHAFLCAGIAREKVNGQSFFIGSSQGTAIADAFQMVADLAGAKNGKKVSLQMVEMPKDMSPIEQRNFVADTEAFRSATGWLPQVDLRSGLEATLGAVK